VSRTRIKICGVRTVDAVEAAAEAGADAVGLVFARKSPRFLDPADAWTLSAHLPPFLASVGLFVNADVDTYMRIEQTCPTDYSQLHGEEPEDVVRACGPRLIKAVRFNQHTITEELTRWSAVDEVDAILVDGSAGGQGLPFDWPRLADAMPRDAKPILLAGGLTPENVADAIRAVRPYAVDVSSGVESAPGVKDPTRIRAFCNAVHDADASLPT
jgi:phosphoribosylanthranilate isomerase